VMAVVHGSRDGDERGASVRGDEDPCLQCHTAAIKEVHLAGEVQGEEAESSESERRVTRGERLEAVVDG